MPSISESNPDRDDRTQNSINVVSWLCWFAACLVTIGMVRHPLYLLIVVFIAVAVFLAYRTVSPRQHLFFGFVWFGLVFMFVSVVFNVFTSHYGETVIVRIPSSIPVIGGPLTAEAFVYGILFGLVFLSGMLVFALFNILVDINDVFRLIPRFMRQTGVVLSIAFGFIPQTIDAARDIREAQSMRGYSFKKQIKSISNVKALVLPIIIHGLERACVLAESMESRAYGSSGKVSVFRRRPNWQKQDFLVVGSAIILVATIGAVFVIDNSILVYSPYPSLGIPDFNAYIGFILLMLLTPVVVRI